MNQDIENALNKLKESSSGDTKKEKAIAIAEHVIESANRFAKNASQLGKLYRKRIFQPKNRAPKKRIEKYKASLKLCTSHYFDAVHLCMLMSQPVPKTTFISGGRAAGKTEAINAWTDQVKEALKDRDPQRKGFILTGYSTLTTEDWDKIIEKPKQRLIDNITERVINNLTGNGE